MSIGILKQNHRTIDLIKRCIDLLIVLVVGYISYYIKFGCFSLSNDSRYYVISGFLVSFLVLNTLPLYKAWRGISLFTELKVVSFAFLLSFLFQALFIFYEGGATGSIKQWFLLWGGGVLLLAVLFRIFIKLFLNFLRRIGFNQRHICLIACGEYGAEVFEHIQSKLSYGFSVQAIFTDVEKTENLNKKFIDKITGNLQDSYGWLADNNVDQVWLAASLENIGIVKKTLYELRNMTVDIRFLPDLSSFNLINHSIVELGDMPCINLNLSPMELSLNRILKRLFDLLIASFLLIFSLPLFFLISITVKASSSGPIFYKQKRVGFNNRIFSIFKFRTMPVGVEKVTGAIWNKKGDMRTIKVGAILRKLSLDELPQLINVIKGEMSLVGPRPERPEFVDKFKDEIHNYMKKHTVKAGITGWAQINGFRGNTDLNKRIEHDIYYIENWSLLFDIKILFLTFFTVIFDKNAY